MSSQSISPTCNCEAAVSPRSGTPTAPRIPNPRSVKFKPFLTSRPRPSYGTQRMRELSTPPCKIKSSINRPISLSAKAVTTPVSMPKHRRNPRATLYSPPPSHAEKFRDVRILPSPGSRRSIISPSETRSYRQSDFDLISRLIN